MITKRMTALALAALVAACGGDDAAEEPADTAPQTPAAQQPAQPTMGEMTMPDWFTADEAANTVEMTITAGLTDAKNYWNFNGATDGNMTITVPQGAEVTLNFVNDDPNMAHSAGVSEMMGGTPSAAPTPEPVFAGAITSNPTSMTEGTMPGESETITFTADTPGEYVLYCYVPGHAATGMWIRFNVSASGEAGVQSSM